MFTNSNFHFHAFRHIVTQYFGDFADRLEERRCARVEFYDHHLPHAGTKTGVIGD